MDPEDTVTSVNNGNTTCKKITQATQVNLKSVGDCFVFECEYYENNETATFCNVAANNNLKIQVDKSVGPNDTTKNVCAGFHWVASIQMISWLT